MESESSHQRVWKFEDRKFSQRKLGNKCEIGVSDRVLNEQRISFPSVGPEYLQEFVFVQVAGIASHIIVKCCKRLLANVRVRLGADLVFHFLKGFCCILPAGSAASNRWEESAGEFCTVFRRSCTQESCAYSKLKVRFTSHKQY